MTKSIYAFALLALVACSNSKKTTQDKAATEAAVPEQKYRFTVSFISIGSGTDMDARTKFDAFIKDFEQKNKVRFLYEKVNWGREGEIDYCFQTSTISMPLQEKFITETKMLLKDTKLVRYERNSTCRAPREK